MTTSASSRDVAAPSGYVCRDRLVAAPLEQLEHLAGFDRDGRPEVARRVVLLPVAGVAELDDAGSQVLEHPSPPVAWVLLRPDRKPHLYPRRDRGAAALASAWTMQGLWVSLTLAPALAVIVFAEETAAATPPTTESVADAFLVAGLLVWAAGFAIEVVAGAQKRRFRADRANKGRFISTGLWAWSRHPNYFGEIVLWTGVAIIAFPILEGWQLATLVSPVFVYVLLTRISGVPLLERKADTTWGGDEEYERYKAQTPVLLPRRPR